MIDPTLTVSLRLASRLIEDVQAMIPATLHEMGIVFYGKDDEDVKALEEQIEKGSNV